VDRRILLIVVRWAGFKRRAPGCARGCNCYASPRIGVAQQMRMGLRGIMCAGAVVAVLNIDCQVPGIIGKPRWFSHSAGPPNPRRTNEQTTAMSRNQSLDRRTAPRGWARFEGGLRVFDQKMVRPSGHRCRNALAARSRSARSNECSPTGAEHRGR